MHMIKFLGSLLVRCLHGMVCSPGECTCFNAAGCGFWDGLCVKLQQNCYVKCMYHLTALQACARIVLKASQCRQACWGNEQVPPPLTTAEAAQLPVVPSVPYATAAAALAVCVCLVAFLYSRLSRTTRCLITQPQGSFWLININGQE
jgi:hypothetical protein